MPVMFSLKPNSVERAAKEKGKHVTTNSDRLPLYFSHVNGVITRWLLHKHGQHAIQRHKTTKRSANSCSNPPSDSFLSMFHNSGNHSYPCRSDYSSLCPSPHYLPPNQRQCHPLQMAEKIGLYRQFYRVPADRQNLVHGDVLPGHFSWITHSGSRHCPSRSGF